MSGVVPLLSPGSARVKQARRLTRRASRLEARSFLAEGPQAIREALQIPGCVSTLFVTPTRAEAHHDLLETARAGGADVALCQDRTIEALTGSVSPQGLVAVCAFVDRSLGDLLERAERLVVVAAHVREPGNAGTLLRCADAVGADAMVFGGTSVDPYNDKSVRASVGSIFHVPFAFDVPLADTITALKAQGFLVLGADGAATTSIDDLADSGRLSGQVAWVFGNEAWGIPDDDLALVDEPVAIPIYGRAESLNVATAAAVCLYATVRQQRNPRRGGAG